MPSVKTFQTSFVGTGIIPACGSSGRRAQGLEGKAHSGSMVLREFLYVAPAQHLSSVSSCFLNLSQGQSLFYSLGHTPPPSYQTERKCSPVWASSQYGYPWKYGFFKWIMKIWIWKYGYRYENMDMKIQMFFRLDSSQSLRLETEKNPNQLKTLRDRIQNESGRAGRNWLSLLLHWPFGRQGLWTLGEECRRRLLGCSSVTG